MREKPLTAEHFRQAEVNCLLEGLDSSGDAIYQATKARVIAGEIDIDDAIRETVDYYKSRNLAQPGSGSIEPGMTPRCSANRPASQPSLQPG